MLLHGRPRPDLCALAFAALVATLSAGCADDRAAVTDAGPCAACSGDQICVQVMHSNGLDLCQSGSVTCEARHPSCAGTACTPDCNFWQCGQGVDAGVLSCLGRVATCPEAIAGALQCWGP